MTDHFFAAGAGHSLLPGPVVQKAAREARLASEKALRGARERCRRIRERCRRIHCEPSDAEVARTRLATMTGEALTTEELLQRLGDD